MNLTEATVADIREVMADPGRTLVCVANRRRPVRNQPPVYDGGIAEVKPEGRDKDGKIFSWRTILRITGPFDTEKEAKWAAAQQLKVYEPQKPEPEKADAGARKSG